MTELNDLIKTMRQTYPNVVSQQLAQVQPMTNDVGEIFKLRYTYTPWYKKLWMKIQHFIMPKFGYKYVPTGMGCFGPNKYKWKKHQ